VRQVRARGQFVNACLVVVAVLLVVAVVLTGGSVTTSEKEARQDSLFVRFDRAALSRIVIERNGRRVILSREVSADAGDADFRIVEPLQDEPDPETIQNLVGSLELATVVRRIDAADVDRVAFGLDAPRFVIALQMGSTSYRLLVGKEAPSPAGAAYVELGGDGISGGGVAVVRGDLIQQIDVDLEQLRRRQILPYLATTLGGLLLEGAGGTRQLERDAGRWWLVHGDGRLLLDRNAFDMLAVHLSRIKAERFLELPEAESAQRGAETVTVTAQPDTASEPRAIIVVGGVCPGDPTRTVAVRREPEPTAACVPRDVIHALRMPRERLVARSPFWLRADEVETVVITRGERRLELARTGSGFTMRTPRAGEVALDVGNRRLEALIGVRGKLLESQPPDPDRFGEGAGVVELSYGEGADQALNRERVQVSRPTAHGTVYLRRELDQAVLEVDRDSARAFEPDATLLRELRVLDFSTRDVREVEVTWGGSNHQSFTRSETGALGLVKPEGFGIDTVQATELTDTLGQLSADRWVADADDGSFGLAEPTLTCRVQLAPDDAGSREHRILVGAPTSRGAYARLDSDPAVFVLPRSSLQVLQTWVVDRAVFVARTADLERVVLEAGGARIELERSGDEFTQLAGEPRLSATAVGAVLEALAGMRAEAAVHLGPPLPHEGMADPALVVRVEREPPGQLPARWRVGAGDSWRGTSVYYARADGVDATYVIARGHIAPLLDSF